MAPTNQPEVPLGRIQESGCYDDQEEGQDQEEGHDQEEGQDHEEGQDQEEGQDLVFTR